MTGWIVGAGVAGACIAWPLWNLTDLAWDKVLSRSVLVCGALLLWPLIRWLRIDWSSLFGSDWNRNDFLRYWGLGLILILPPAMVFVVCGYRVFDETWLEELDDLARAVSGGLFGGVLAALFEETIFRGVVLVALSRVMRVVSAVVVSSALYALSHFLETDFHGTVPAFSAGFMALVTTCAPLLDPSLWWDSFVGLFALGVLLCLVRLRTRSLLPCVAMHAAWIFFLRVYKEMTGRDIHHEWTWLVGEYDNFTGLVVALWLLVLIGLYLRFGSGKVDPEVSPAGRVPASR